jgi:hypothetical protein
MEAASDIQWMREERFDGKKEEATSEEVACESKG